MYLTAIKVKNYTFNYNIFLKIIFKKLFVMLFMFTVYQTFLVSYFK